MLLEEFGGEVPERLEDLVRLPGVGRKTANVVAAERGAAQGIVVDTHVRRLSQRLGLTKQQDPVKIERDLMRIVPRADWPRFPHLLIWHGRRVCDARRPALRGVRPRRPLPVEPRLAGQVTLLLWVRLAGATATRRPPSSSYAGKKSARTIFLTPERVFSVSFWSKRRTPYSSVRAAGVGPLPSGSKSVVITSCPSRSRSR